MDTIVQVEGLRKTYGTTVAVDELSSEVRQGEIFGMVGPQLFCQTLGLHIEQPTLEDVFLSLTSRKIRD